MELNFVKSAESRSDLQVSISEWENKVINIESVKKKFLWKVDPKKRILCMVHVFLGCQTAFDDRFYCVLSDLICIYR